MRRARLHLLIGGLAAAVPAAAAVNVTPGPSFVVEITAGEDVTIDCSLGLVRVLVDMVPTVYATTCPSVTSLTVDGGPGDNAIDLAAIDGIDFSSLSGASVAGNDGMDTILGSQLPDEISGGEGNDTITGNNENDVISGGPGDDTLVWNPGNDNDTVTGDAGTDTFQFNGSNTGEMIVITPEGTGFDLTRDVGTVAVDVDTVETLQLTLLGGDDQVSTVPLPLTAQIFDAGSQSVEDTLIVDFAGFCFAQAGGVFFGVNFGTITTIGFEDQTVLGSPGECMAADVDGNGAIAALTDGLLMLRYFFGLRGDALIQGAVAANCGRCSAAEIEAYIQSLY